MASLESFNNKKFKIIDTAVDDLTLGLGFTQKQIVNDILKKLSRFSTEEGRFIFDAGAVKRLNELAEEIRRSVLNSNYKSKVADYLRDFDALKDVNTALHASVNDLAVGRIGISSVQSQSIKQTTNALIGQGMNVNFVDKVNSLLFDSVVSGSTIAQTEAKLRAFVLGDAQRLGQLERYVGQIARDSIMQFNGQIQTRIAQEFELDCVSYEGSLIKDSREQCVRWVTQFNGLLKHSQLQREINWALTNGSGMIPTTTPDTFIIFRGGFRCRHIATPVKC